MKKNSIHIVKSVFLEKEYEFNSKNDGKIRVFAVRVNNVIEMVQTVTTIQTEINPNGFLTYLGNDEPIIGDSVSVKNAEVAIDAGENIIVFHEDISIAYAEKLDDVMKKYPSIKIIDFNKLSMRNK